jgi:rod shape-determining protein MreB
MEIRGRDLSTGLPRNITITSAQILEALEDSINKIINTVKATLEKTPPELSADLVEKGIVITGGGALIRNFDQLLSNKTNMPVYIADEPLECVVRGTSKTLDELEKLKPVLINARKRR